MADRRSSWFSPRLATALVLGMALALLVGGVLAFPRIEAGFIKREQDDARATLRLVSEAIDQTLGRYAPLPGLIASDPLLRDLLRDAPNEGVAPFLNEKLRHTAKSVSASDIYVMDASGMTVVASNYREERSFVGKSFAFRPYFQDAMQGETSLYHALGTTSGERGFFFSAPILDGIEVIGVLAVKVTADVLEDAWADSARGIIVADQNGIAFLSSEIKYRMRALAPLSEGARARIAETQQFPAYAIRPIPFSASLIGAGAVEVTLGSEEDQQRFLSNSLPLTQAGWHAIVLTPLDPIRSEATYSLMVWSLAVAAMAMFGLMIVQRRARVQERLRVEQSQRDMLERLVRERTADLDAANVSLRGEVAERRLAEERLRKTQKELVQAGKLAALGQMSAALSHEINQPLAAVKSYADNAALYLQRDRAMEAGENISRISAMVDRMAKISGHLRNFARRPGDTLSAVPVGATIREAVALIEPQLRQSGAEVVLDLPEDEVWAMGGRLRLQQVLVNIITNALDAMADGPLRRVEVALALDAGPAITIRDHGPGLPPGETEQVFEAFYTTKEAGAGMGLGLSISFNIVEDFGGKLSAANHPDGGAVFRVELQRAETQSMVAE